MLKINNNSEYYSKQKKFVWSGNSKWWYVRITISAFVTIKISVRTRNGWNKKLLEILLSTLKIKIKLECMILKIINLTSEITAIAKIWLWFDCDKSYLVRDITRYLTIVLVIRKFSRNTKIGKNLRKISSKFSYDENMWKECNFKIWAA